MNTTVQEAKKRLALHKDVDGLVRKINDAVMALHNAEAAKDWVKDATGEALIEWGEDLYGAVGELEDVVSSLGEAALAVIRLGEAMAEQEEEAAPS